MDNNANSPRTRRATDLERKHFTEMTEPIIDYIRANAQTPSDYCSSINIIRTLHEQLSDLIQNCRRFGYVPTSLGLLVVDDSIPGSLDMQLSKTQEAEIIAALEALYSRLTGRK